MADALLGVVVGWAGLWLEFGICKFCAPVVYARQRERDLEDAQQSGIVINGKSVAALP